MRKGYVRKTRICIERMAGSKNGNPRYRLTFADGTSYPTAPDANCAYGADNPDLRGDVDIMLNGRYQIVHILPAN